MTAAAFFFGKEPSIHAAPLLDADNPRCRRGARRPFAGMVVLMLLGMPARIRDPLQLLNVFVQDLQAIVGQGATDARSHHRKGGTYKRAGHGSTSTTPTTSTKHSPGAAATLSCPPTCDADISAPFFVQETVSGP